MSKLLFRRANRSNGYAYVTGHLVQTLQNGLDAKGFAVGEIDGIFGSDTETAVKAWQSETGHNVSGAVTLDEWTELTGLPAPDLFDLCLQITARFEGHGFRKAAGNFDGAWLTWGIIGFTLKHKEIQAIVKAADDLDPSIVNNAFGPLADELRDVMGRTPGQQERWADQISVGSSKYPIQPEWRDAFARFGGEPRVQGLQVSRARDRYWTLGQGDANALGLTSDLGHALCFDIAVQNGGVSADEARLFRDQCVRLGVHSASDRRKVLADVIADTSNPRWHDDVLSRKTTIATGMGLVHGERFSTEEWGLTGTDSAAAETFASASGAATVIGGAPGDDRSRMRTLASTPEPESFEAFIDGLGLRHFNAAEFLCMGAAHTDQGSPAHGLNRPPPRELWPNIVLTARVLDDLRNKLGEPIVLTSVYRSPAYNTAVGGVSGSQHMAFTAADFVVRSASAPSDWAAVLKQMRADGRFQGGIGVYNSFVHVDTRGSNADW